MRELKRIGMGLLLLTGIFGVFLIGMVFPILGIIIAALVIAWFIGVVMEDS